MVSYLLKALGYSVLSNNFLAFPGVIADATVANQSVRLTSEDVEAITTGPSLDARDFIRRTFEGISFTPDDLSFLDSAWSHIDLMTGGKRALAIAALELSAARKQPRGVFTFAGARYDDGRRDLRLSLREHFAEAVAEYNAVVFEGRKCTVASLDVMDVPTGHDVVYLDPPYAPPKDDNCYVKRYHFLEGLAVYWREQTILENTTTKKLKKKHTPFSYKSTAGGALMKTFEKFSDSNIVLSYSSNAVPDVATIESLLRRVKHDVTVYAIDHRYHFGTHAAAKRRTVSEYIFVGR